MPTRGTKQELERLHKLVQNTCWKKRRRYVMDIIVRRGEGFEHVCEIMSSTGNEKGKFMT